jgi:hypothetical protein
MQAKENPACALDAGAMDKIWHIINDARELMWRAESVCRMMREFAENQIDEECAKLDIQNASEQFGDMAQQGVAYLTTSRSK